MASSTVYGGDHSLTFITMDESESRNTWTDWHLIPSSRLVVAEAGVSTNFIEIPGRGDPVDLTEYLVGKPVYGPRSGSWEFLVDNYHEYWDAIRTRIVNFIHGKRMRVILSDIPTRYWEGRFTVDNWQPGENFSQITINYVLDVHSYSIYKEGDDWLWDPFNFDTDYTDQRDREGRL